MVIKILKHYGVFGGNRFAAVELSTAEGSVRLDVRTRDGRHGSYETRAGRIKAAALALHEGQLPRGATAAQIAAYLDERASKKNA